MTTTGLDLARITHADLKWWRGLIDELDWVFAVTYAEGAPHEYVSDRTESLTPADFVRAARVIRTFGEPQKFYKWTRIYLVHKGWKYWDMEGDDVATCNLINRGRAHHIYGVQNAPVTRSEHHTAYNGLATFWDSQHALLGEERECTIALLSSLGNFTKRRVLDIGCGTGLALDLGVTEPVRYVGIDPSQAMLNELVRKYPHLAGVHTMTFARTIERRVLGGTRFDLVVALGGSASYLSADDLDAIAAHAAGPVVLSVFADDHQPAAGDLSAAQLADGRERLKMYVTTRGGTVSRVGRFDVAVVAS